MCHVAFFVLVLIYTRFTKFLFMAMICSSVKCR